MITIAFLLIFVAVEGADGCQMSTINGKCCKFPFTYKEKTYHSCTIKDNDYQPWCYTTEGNGKYGNCKIDCPKCTKTGRECCKFPFTYNGITHNSCPNSNSGYWCATTKNYESTGCWTRCKQQDEKWALQKSHVCFAAKGSNFGMFKLKTGPVYGLKLVHKAGWVSCSASEPNWKSNWGCNNPDNDAYYNANNVGILITDTLNNVVYPKKYPYINGNGYYNLPGYNSMSPELVFSYPNSPLSAGAILKIWYGEDYESKAEGNNAGVACVDVYAQTVQ